MKKTFVNKNYFNDKKHLLFDYNIESTLYLKNNELSKILREKYIKDRQNTIEELYKIDNDNSVLVTSILYDKTGTIGYTMLYYYNYKTIDNLINDKNISNNDKQIIISKLLDVFNYFDKIKYVYDDIHEKNIIYNDTNIKIVDLDSGLFKKRNNNIDFDSRKRIQEMRLTKLILSIIYNVPLYNIENFIKINKKNLSNDLNKLYDYVLNEKYIHFNVNEYSDDIKLTLK